MAGVENFSVELLLCEAKTCCSDHTCPNLTFLTGQAKLKCQIVSKNKLKNLIGPKFEEEFKNDEKGSFMAICLFRHQKITMTQYKRLKQDVKDKKAHYKINYSKMLLYSDLKEGIEA